MKRSKERLLTYKEFRTGLTFYEVYQMLWSNSEDSKDWKYKRRGTILGMWRMLKKQMYEEYLDSFDRRPKKKKLPKLEDVPF